jgi:4'-phosphopantetheinyl transferase
MTVRAALREVLGEYLQIHPSAINISNTESGKPFLEKQPGPDAFDFNVSHAGDVALIAVGRCLQVGVDIERVRETKSRELVLEDFFSPAEQAWVRAQPNGTKTEAFIRAWTRREAAAKATGIGLLKAFAMMSMPAPPYSPLGFSVLLSSALTSGRRLWIRDLNPVPGYAGALCVEKKNANPLCLRFAW